MEATIYLKNRLEVTEKALMRLLSGVAGNPNENAMAILDEYRMDIARLNYESAQASD